MNYGIIDAIALFSRLRGDIGKQPTRKDWNNCKYTPSDMFIRSRYGSWGEFLKTMGVKPFKYCPSKNGQSRKGIRNKSRSLVSNGHGYIQVFEPGHPVANKAGYCLEHRMIAWDEGKLKDKKKVVHHLDENKINNGINNLEVLNIGVHTSIHSKGVRKILKNGKECTYPNCKEITASKYGLCRKHYKIQWQRVRDGLIENLTIIGTIHDQEPNE